MTLRLAALGLLAAAGLVHATLTLPARRARDEARAAFAHKRAEREQLRAEVARLERRTAAMRAGAPAGDAAAARALRLSLLAATRGTTLADVAIAARPEPRGPAAARGRLAGAGSQAELLRVAERLADPASGVVLERLDFVVLSGRLRLEALAVSLRAGS
jgi:hypothetical protein